MSDTSRFSGVPEDAPVFVISVAAELAGMHAQTLFETALREGIGTSPGVLFSSRGDYADCLRLSCGLPWNDKLDRAMRRLGQWAAQA